MNIGKVKLVSQEGEILEVDKDTAVKSLLIKNILEDEESDTEIPLPGIKIAVLKKVFEYCEKYKHENPPEIEKPLKSNDLAEIVPEFDAKYIDIDKEDILNIIMAANYLDIKPLLDLSCAKIACFVKGKTPEEITTSFNIQNEFTPKEKAQIKEENTINEQED